MHVKTVSLVFITLAAISASFCARAAHRPSGSGGTANIGERFFLETRFSKYFYDHSGGNANFVLTNGDPVMDLTATINGPLPGPFAGQAMNCRACHLVEEHESVRNRTYADFAPRSPIPANGDGRTHAPRNSIDMVNSLLLHSTPLFLHYDGQFVTAQDLIISTFTGRNFGWKPSEYATAVAHIVHIIREDNASGGLAQQYGGWTYAQAFAGGAQIEPQYRILPAYSLDDVSITNTADPKYVSDERIIRGIAVVVQDYMETLVFATDINGLFTGSPYDVFLIKNGLPRQPAANETPIQYGRRLLQRLANLSNPQYVSDPADGHLVTHNQPFQFGPTELAGLKLFLTEGKAPSGGIQSPAGNCIACHAPPAFTDFLFHNTGAAQEEYDSIHGAGAFINLSVPGLSARQTNYDAYLPPTTNHPNAAGTFITPPSLAQPGMVDLGLWNVFANTDMPAPQPALQQILPLLMPTPAPQIVEASRSGGNLVFSGTNGTPGWTYYVLASTNLLLPPASWDIVSTNTFDSLGKFNVTNPILPNSRKFFMLAAAGPSAAQALPHTIALFKTPDLRDLVSSEPYLHTGRINTLQDVITFYQNVSGLSRAGLLRNAPRDLSEIYLDVSSVVPLAAFLRSLSEDYEDIPCPCP
jgi:hypothetical protein